jgi:GNAT superfamily N-acetyltransferase
MPKGESEIVFRPATAEDANHIAHILRVGLTYILPDLPALHTREEDIGFVTDSLKEYEAVVAVRDTTPIGFIIFKEDWISHLYILPEFHRMGIGTTLVSFATEKYSHLQLWTFQRNAQARRFYEKHGFISTTFTNGESNEEKEPDMMYEWRRST